MALPQTKRQKIFDRVLNRMHQIRSDVEPDKYNTQAGRHVFPWRQGTISEEELASFTDTAGLIVRDVDETKATNGDHTLPVTNLRGGEQKFIRELHIQIEVACGTESAADLARKVIADVEVAVSQDARWHDVNGRPLAIGTRPRIDRSVVEHESLKVGGVVIEFFIHYVTGAFNPYQ